MLLVVILGVVKTVKGETMIRDFIERFGQSWTACFLCMVGGDLSVVSVGHAITASKTGVLTAVAYLLARFIPWRSEYVALWLLGVLTAFADIIVHPSHYGAEWQEAVITGLVAVWIAFCYEKGKKHYVQRIQSNNAKSS